jgi:tRNA G18 (ribose-2'-O)-methylase SpoU
MSIFRIAAAAGLLFVLAPDETMKVARAALGLAEEAKSLQSPAADVALSYCRANPSACADAVRQASGSLASGLSQTAPAKPSKP